MVKEASKAMKRRLEEETVSSISWKKDIFKGEGIDIGAGNDCIDAFTDYLPNLISVKNWDKKDGDAQYMEGVNENTFDFVHSSHCLEHMRDPKIALKNWIRILKSGGFLIVTVPEWLMYEKKIWPSRYNGDHKTAWSFEKEESLRHNHVICLPEFLDSVCKENNCEIIVKRKITKGWDPQNSGDQTLPPNGPECAIEFVLKKN